MFAHIDADLIVYRAGFAAEKKRYFVPFEDKYHFFEGKKEANAFMEEAGLDPAVLQTEVNLEPVGNALYNVKSMIQTTLERTEADAFRLYLTGKTNFRDDVAVTKVYKGNRDEAHKPHHGTAIKQYMHENYDVNVSEYEEADDVVAYNHYRMWKEDTLGTVLCSVDKDLDMVPGMHYSFLKDECYLVTPEAALRKFCTQLLTGDSTDNIPGLPKIGPKKADAILAEVDPYHWELEVLDQYRRKGFDMKYLNEQGQLLWMRREPREMYESGMATDYYVEDLQYA